ncbi:MAG: hypothetical protein A2W85_03675 [Bacteroidetes bacterium GWF2_41_31]|jgi:hypothetical protein|nr:MAG: hypothetical protein A2W85_03675 [Bacteroidetes bacterium GWF2_41_31]
MENTAQFCKIVRQRSLENKHAIDLLSRTGLTGQVMAVLRQELDSMVRVIFLLSQTIDERNHLISLTLSGQKWRLRSNAQVTDKQMVELADTLNGWTKSVYKFGCAFIHLSTFHDYAFNDPFENLGLDEINSIKTHLNYYHGFPMTDGLTMSSISFYLPRVFDKIESNLESYIQSLEAQRTDFY